MELATECRADVALPASAAEPASSPHAALCQEPLRCSTLLQLWLLAGISSTGFPCRLWAARYTFRLETYTHLQLPVLCVGAHSLHHDMLQVLRHQLGISSPHLRTLGTCQGTIILLDYVAGAQQLLCSVSIPAKHENCLRERAHPELKAAHVLCLRLLHGDHSGRPGVYDVRPPEVRPAASTAGVSESRFPGCCERQPPAADGLAEGVPVQVLSHPDLATPQQRDGLQCLRCSKGRSTCRCRWSGPRAPW